jgi:hypothetical protein
MQPIEWPRNEIGPMEHDFHRADQTRFFAGTSFTTTTNEPTIPQEYPVRYEFVARTHKGMSDNGPFLEI